MQGIPRDVLPDERGRHYKMNAESQDLVEDATKLFTDNDNKRIPDTGSILRRPPMVCLRCGSSRNCINGLYCMVLKRYVQHESAPSCGTGEQRGDLECRRHG